MPMPSISNSTAGASAAPNTNAGATPSSVRISMRVAVIARC